MISTSTFIQPSEARFLATDSASMKQLILNSDDFGLCHSVNLGVVKGFTEGLLTQASMMVPTPWFEEAAALTLQYDIPVGIHLTATCEWSNYRWRPLTGGKSLTHRDGTCLTKIEEARKMIDPSELEDEFAAQVELALARNLRPQHLDVHMGMVNAEVFTKICRQFNLPAILPPWMLVDHPELVEVCYPFDSCLWLKGQTQRDWVFDCESLEKRGSLFQKYLQEMPEGVHYNACHVSVDSDEVASMDKNRMHLWSKSVRVADLKLVCDPRFNRLIKKLNIQMTSLRSARI
jgi:hypothetical protein